MKSPNAVICREKPALTVYPYGSERVGWEEARDEDVNSAQINCTISHLEQAGKGDWILVLGAETYLRVRRLLLIQAKGASLMRDSSSPESLLTPSVKTSVGPTHIRICYSAGCFGFDSSVLAQPKVQRFKDAVDLVQFYSLKQAGRLGLSEQELTSASKDPAVHLKLIKPLYASVPALQHLCRLTIDRSGWQVTALPLPLRLKDDLLKYPYLL
ncbi:suppressor of cytokine signaling 2-like [Emydura macquarii macquarii]|uniref:suppressor of cytokine signaling 2-like n=1 Tax=Emydura macquarii macquarii TaxID=1129001 RepID=UPI00352B6799